MQCDLLHLLRAAYGTQEPRRAAAAAGSAYGGAAAVVEAHWTGATQPPLTLNSMPGSELLRNMRIPPIPPVVIS